MIKSLSEVIKDLWQKNFFSTERTIQNVITKLQEDGYNFDYDSIYSVLKDTDFILVKFKTLDETPYTIPSYIQRVPPEDKSKMEDEIIYSKGYSYDFYKNIRDIFSVAQKEIIISDSYVGEELFTLYLDNIPDNVEIKILTSDIENKDKNKCFEIAKKFSLKPGKKIEIRKSPDCHDRMIFVDSEAWVCGNSMKDAGKKPTYLIKIKHVSYLRSIFENVWSNAKKISIGPSAE